MYSCLSEESFLQEFFGLPSRLLVPITEEHVADPYRGIVQETLDP